MRNEVEQGENAEAEELRLWVVKWRAQEPRAKMDYWERRCTTDSLGMVSSRLEVGASSLETVEPTGSIVESASFQQWRGLAPAGRLILSYVLAMPSFLRSRFQL